ncbi:MFS transporter [Streptomyces thinghirensis]|nr:MFS transporter [Streptomyces thinghirensis]
MKLVYPARPGRLRARTRRLRHRGASCPPSRQTSTPPSLPRARWSPPHPGVRHRLPDLRHPALRLSRTHRPAGLPGRLRPGQRGLGVRHLAPRAADHPRLRGCRRGPLPGARRGGAAASLVERERRGRALAVIMGGMSSGTVIGVPAGVYIAQHTSWRATLWLVTGIGVVSLIGLLLRLPQLPATETVSLRQRAQVVTDPRVASVVGVSLARRHHRQPRPLHVLRPGHGHRRDGKRRQHHPVPLGLGHRRRTRQRPRRIPRGQGPPARHPGRRHPGDPRPSLLAFRITASVTPLLALIPIAVWGAVGWALQVLQQNDLLAARGERGGPGRRRPQRVRPLPRQRDRLRTRRRGLRLRLQRFRTPALGGGLRGGGAAAPAHRRTRRGEEAGGLRRTEHRACWVTSAASATD